MRNWKIEKDVFINAVKNNYSIASTIRELGLFVGGANYKMVKMRIKEWKLDTSHWTGQAHNKGKNHNYGKRIPLEEILIVDSTYATTSNLKARLLKEGLLNYKCSECEIIDQWNGKFISLHLDHINGANDDNRLENLRLLCPNCHSQTDTFAGKRLKKPDNFCPDCGIKIKRASKTCGRCRIKLPHIASRTNIKRFTKLCTCGTPINWDSITCMSCRPQCHTPKETKINWPSNEIILGMIANTSYLAVGKELGVSDNAVRKHLKLQGIEVPKKLKNRC